jgi:hypothetical protein
MDFTKGKLMLKNYSQPKVCSKPGWTLVQLAFYRCCTSSGQTLTGFYLLTCSFASHSLPRPMRGLLSNVGYQFETHTCYCRRWRLLNRVVDETKSSPPENGLLGNHQHFHYCRPPVRSGRGGLRSTYLLVTIHHHLPALGKT